MRFREEWRLTWLPKESIGKAGLLRVNIVNKSIQAEVTCPVW